MAESRGQGWISRQAARIKGLGPWGLVGVAAVLFGAGIVFWGGFNWAMELSNTETFCISCHEMRTTVYAELKQTVHFTNRTGVRASCADCHVPKEWVFKVSRKVRASTKELPHKVLGSISTPEKFEAKRLELASSVWRTMKATDSRECRNCHTLASMDVEKQGRQARRRHETANEQRKTCIECHQGIAHRLPDNWEQTYEKVVGAM
jgi:cytochrome c-type protein NapC